LSLKAKSQDTDKWLDRAISFHQRGDFKTAAEYYRRYLRQNPGNAEILHTLGGLYYQIQDYKLAGEYLEKAHRIAPQHQDYLNDLAAFLLTRGDYLKAIIHLTNLVEQSPGNPRGHYNLGLALHGAGRLAEAITAFEYAIQLQPEYAEAWYNLGSSYHDLGQLPKAEEAYRRAIKIEPGLIQPYLKLGEILEIQRRYDNATKIYQKASELDRNHLGIINKLASALHQSGKTEEGIAILNKALNKYPQDITLLNSLGILLHNAGNIDQAEEVYRRALFSDHDNMGIYLNFARIRKFSHKDEDIINRMKDLLNIRSMKDSKRKNICYALGKIYDDCQEYDKAFYYYSAANEIQHRQTPYNRDSHEKRVNDTISVFTSGFITKYSYLGSHIELPLFIIGMPRSGTTLVEQIITSHSQVAGGGELEYFNSLSTNLTYLLGKDEPYPFCCLFLSKGKADEIIGHYLELLRRHSDTARFVSDKMPSNFIYLGLIHLFFPKAPVIHCIRNPLDVCLSIYFQSFGKGHDYATDLVDIGHYYSQYKRLMDHWRNVLPEPFFENRYEELVTDQAKQSHKLIEFCGLDWEDSCLDYFRHKRDVKTASNWQVRQPIYDSSVGRWKNYAKYLEPLMQLYEGKMDEL